MPLVYWSPALVTEGDLREFYTTVGAWLAGHVMKGRLVVLSSSPALVMAEVNCDNYLAVLGC